MTPADAIRQPALKLRPSRFPGRFFCLAEGTPGILRFGAGAPPAGALIWERMRLSAGRVVPFEAAWNVFFAM